VQRREFRPGTTLQLSSWTITAATSSVWESVTRPGRTGRMLLNLTAFSVEPGSSFMADVKSLLGPSSVSL
jgi:hypothetical protein